jgi:hypothetical protein
MPSDAAKKARTWEMKWHSLSVRNVIITYLQYLLLLMEVLFTVFFTDGVFTVHYYVNSVQVLFTEYYALDLLFLDNGLLWSIA